MITVMNHLRFLTVAVALAGTSLPGQSPDVSAAQTVIHDAAWSSSVAALAASRAPVGAARLTNVSVRARAGRGADTLIAGAVVQGAGNLPMLVRAIGPGLGQFGVSGFLRDPKLEIFRGEVSAAQTNTTGPGVAAASAYLGAFPPIERSGTSTVSDAALAGQASAGVLTSHCSPSGATAGIALLEFYDATAVPTETSARFVNLSARSRVETGEGIVVVGFVVAGEGSVTLLLRGIGATLGQFGITDFLPDPAIELFAGGVRIAGNDNWRAGGPAEIAKLETARLAVSAFALTGPNDAALLVTLPAGNYTLQVRGAGVQTGVALAEIHEISRVSFDAAVATNAVGLDLFRELARTRPGTNLIVSPYSIESALALAYVGADGGTREELARALHFPADSAAVATGFAGLRSALEKTAADSRALADARTKAGERTDPIEWSAANRLFGQQDYAFRDAFLTLMRDGFAAPFEPMDFRRDPERSRLTINGWVETQTRRKITDLIPAGALTEDTRLVLINALYLKAPWQKPFEKTATTPRPFRPATGGSRNVPTMNQTGSFGYATDEGFTIVTLNYLGLDLQFVLALPDEGLSVEAVAGKLTATHLARWARLADTSRRNVALYLPKFTVKGATVPLGTALRALGMRSAFDEPRGSANFDRIAPRRPDDYLAISDVFHQTYVALDEEGTEAAAATAVVLISVASAPPPPLEVRVDRPFLFAIQHRTSGVCLFFGRIMDLP